MARKFETAIIVITQDEKIIPTCKRIYHIRDGVTHEEAGEGGGVRMRERLNYRRDGLRSFTSALRQPSSETLTRGITKRRWQ